MSPYAVLTRKGNDKRLDAKSMAQLCYVLGKIRTDLDLSDCFEKPYGPELFRVQFDAQTIAAILKTYSIELTIGRNNPYAKKKRTALRRAKANAKAGRCQVDDLEALEEAGLLHLVNQPSKKKPESPQNKAKPKNAQSIRQTKSNPHSKPSLSNTIQENNSPDKRCKNKKSKCPKSGMASSSSSHPAQTSTQKQFPQGEENLTSKNVPSPKKERKNQKPLKNSISTGTSKKKSPSLKNEKEERSTKKASSSSTIKTRSKKARFRSSKSSLSSDLASKANSHLSTSFESDLFLTVCRKKSPTLEVGDEFRRTQKDKSPKIKSVKLQQWKHEVIKKHNIETQE